MKFKKFFKFIACCYAAFSVNAQATMENEENIKCRYFNGKPGSCRYGEKCKYTHVKETPEQYRLRKQKQHEDYLKREEYRREKEKYKAKQPILDNRFSRNKTYSSYSRSSPYNNTYSSNSTNSSYQPPRIGDRDSWTGATYRGQEEKFGSKWDVWESPAGSSVGSFCASGWPDS